MGLAREILDGLEKRLHAHAGFDLPEWVVETRATARMTALDLAPEEYLALVCSPRGTAELAALVETVRVGETRFFRHKPHVDALLDVVVPAWRERGERSPRVWSAGCATGEEAYTLALVLARALPKPSYSPTILGTDVSAEALAIARAAHYPAADAADVPPPWREGLLEQGDSIRVRPEIAGLVRFKQQNLADAELPRGFDLVWCRNVLIYFGPEARMRVLEKLVSALTPDGFLFLGYSETLRNVAGLRAIQYADQILWQKASAAPVTPAQRGSRPEPIHASLKQPVSPDSKQPASSDGKQPVSPESKARVAVKGRDLRAAGALPKHSVFKSSPPPPLAAPKLSSAAARAAKSSPAARPNVRITVTAPAALSAEISAALRTPGLQTLTIDLDAAELLDDAVAPILRRAGTAAEHEGIQLHLRALRPGTQRWLRRHGLSRGPE